MITDKEIQVIEKLLLSLYKTKKERSENLNQKEIYSIYHKKLELESKGKLTNEIKNYFSGALKLLRKHSRDDCVEGYNYIKHKVDFCKKYNLDY